MQPQRVHPAAEHVRLLLLYNLSYITCNHRNKKLLLIKIMREIIKSHLEKENIYDEISLV